MVNVEVGATLPYSDVSGMSAADPWTDFHPVFTATGGKPLVSSVAFTHRMFSLLVFWFCGFVVSFQSRGKVLMCMRAPRPRKQQRISGLRPALCPAALRRHDGRDWFIDN